jgi:hypothetical protein
MILMWMKMKALDVTYTFKKWAGPRWTALRAKYEYEIKKAAIKKKH